MPKVSWVPQKWVHKCKFAALSDSVWKGITQDKGKGFSVVMDEQAVVRANFKHRGFPKIYIHHEIFTYSEKVKLNLTDLPAKTSPQATA